MIVFQPRALLIAYLALWGLFLAGEAILTLRRRATEGRAAEDRGFRGHVLIVFLLANLVAVFCLRLFAGVSFGTPLTSCVGIAMMLVGLALRWWSIAHLGRFFTVDVAVGEDQRVIDSGPYRLVRHPSYAGLLLVIAGIALCFGNLASMAVLLVPFVWLLLKRMRIEEAALTQGLGDAYRAYMRRTRRLIPGLY